MAYDNPGGIIAAFVVLQVVVFIVVTMRFFARLKTGPRILASDWLIVGAAVIGTGLTAMEIYGCSTKALGVPLSGTIQDPEALNDRLIRAKKIEVSYLLMGISGIGLVKISATSFYLRIFSTPIFRRVVIVWMVVLILWTVSFVLATFLECGTRLLVLFGSPSDYIKYCGAAIHIGWAMVATDMATDLGTLLLPVPMVWSLQMPTRQKLLVLAVFATGALSVGASVAKAYIYINASLGIWTEDAIILLTGLSVWNLVEIQVGVIAASGPTIRPVLQDILASKGMARLVSSLASTLGVRSSAAGSRDPASHPRPSASVGRGRVSAEDESEKGLVLVPSKERAAMATVELARWSSDGAGVEPGEEERRVDGIHVRTGVTVEHA